MLKKMVCAVTMALSAGISAGTWAASTPVLINPDGIAGGDPTVTVGSLDWNVGNGLSVGVIPFTAGSTVQFYGHATLQGFNDAGGSPITVGGLNSAYEWTYVTAFRETLVGVTPTAGGGLLLEFKTTGGANNFFEIWVSVPNSSSLIGSGFNSEGGAVLALSGHHLSGIDSNFLISDITPPIATPPLDGFGTNNYTDTVTTVGSGSGNLAVVVDSFNPAFFTGLTVGSAISLDFTTQQRLNFNTTDPSGCFWDGAAYTPGAGNVLCGASTLGSTALGSPGGALIINQFEGPNVQIQTDASSVFLIPEPGSLLLLGVGLLGLGIAGQRKYRMPA